MSTNAATSYLDLPDDELASAPVIAEQQDTSTDESAQEDTGTQTETEDTQADTSDETVDNSSEELDTSTQTTDTSEQSTESVDTIDYKAEYQRLLTPFKANGRDITVTGIDDAIALMQMGANYNKKMAGLKPHLKVVKMLEKNGLLDESKLSYLVDLHGRNPEAIAKLLKDSGIDPLDMDQEKADAYKPVSRAVDDREMELDSVLDDIKSSPAYGRTLSEVSGVWDSASKETVAQNPQLLKVINSHMETGIYDLIQQTVENEKLFGRLQGLSDIEAYRKVGDAIQAKGGFDHLVQGQRTPAKPVVAASKPVVQDDKLRDKKRAAAPVKPAATTQVTKEYNPLSLPDAEFEKLSNPSYR